MNWFDHTPRATPGLAGVEGWFAMVHAAVPDFRWEIDDVIAEGDKVVTRTTWGGTQTGAFMGIPVTGKHVQVTGIEITRWANGKAVEHWANGKAVERWANEDALGMLQQLGVITMPGYRHPPASTPPAGACGPFLRMRLESRPSAVRPARGQSHRPEKTKPCRAANQA